FSIWFPFFSYYFLKILMIRGLGKCARESCFTHYSKSLAATYFLKNLPKCRVLQLYFRVLFLCFV
uniref:Uncharacterized protein n=1 Tax=Macaca fascicularis TaxID=9541 RepID=A0A7N9C850_MACFA